MEHAQHFHSHAFRLGTLENGIANALHPGTHVIHSHDLGGAGGWLGGLAGGTGLGKAYAHKSEENIQQSDGFFHTANLDAASTIPRTVRAAREKWLLKS
jgi:predicted lipid-binding transport protein (Tim44 family)